MLAFDLSRIYGRLRLRGNTRADFLHRMSTADLRHLQPGQGRPTVLTTPIGRMIDWVAVLAETDSILLLTGGGNQAKVLGWLRKYVFFNDDVQLADESDVTPLWGAFGDGADAWADEIAPGASDWALYTHAGGLVKALPLQGAGYYWIGDRPPPAAVLPAAEYDALRIQAGYPAYPSEINENYIPLEAGLWSSVSFTKGCYIGQEIIARMESRGQIAKKLVKLVLSAPADQVAPGDRLWSGAAEVGLLTSVSAGPSVGHRPALGYVRTAYAVEGAELWVAERDVQARVIGLVSA